MKKMMKLAALLAALALLFGAIGCSSDGGDDSHSEYDGSNPPPISGDGDITQPPISGDGDITQPPISGDGDITQLPITGDGDITQPEVPEDLYNPGDWNIDENGMLVEYKGHDTDVTIPKSVKKIGTAAFRYSKVTNVKIPDGVTEIGMQAFDGSSLKSFTLPSSLKTICYGAFNECTGIEKVDIPEGVETIDKGAFNRCTGLKTVTLPVSLKEIGLYAFNECESLTSVTYAGTLPQWNEIITGYRIFYMAGVATITGKDGVIIPVQ